MEQLLNGDVQRSREHAGLNGATDRSAATLSITFSAGFLSHPADVTSQSAA